MNKKPISTILQFQNFNSTLFQQSISLVQSIKPTIPLSKIPIELSRSNNQIKKKQQQIQTLLSKTIKLFGQIIGTQKNTISTVMDYGVDVFQQLTDLIQTQCQTYNQKKRNIKKDNGMTTIVNTNNINKEGEQSLSSNNNRPQSLYSSIKPAQFTRHIHSPPSIQYVKLTCESFTPSISLTQPYIYISTVESLQKMILQLSQHKQIAVDLQHSNKSYQGFTCLMQISTREKDYIIDVFPIWRFIHKLKVIFQDQKIIKVMHGADMDTKWLQRDFNVHIINLFDTYKASRVLGYPKFSYAYLLGHYCDTYTDKKYQLADWRQRPLIAEMLHYARLDTHYLLEIWDKMIIDLTKQAVLMNYQAQQVIKNVYLSSHQVTLSQVELFSYKRKQLYQNIKNDMKHEDFTIIQKVFWIIDKISRQQDQSFDDMLNKRTLVDIIARTKDIINNRKANIDMLRVKIDRLIGVLRSHKHSKIHLLLIPLKKQLEKQFLQSKKEQQKSNKKIIKDNNQKMLIQQLQQQKYKEKYKEKQNNIIKIYQEEPRKTYQQQSNFTYQNNKNFYIEQLEYPLKTYENFSIQQKLTQSNNNSNQINNFNTFQVQFQPIMSFLSERFNLSQKTNQIQQQSQQQSQDMQLQQQVNNKINEINQKQQGEMQGFMQFKRIKPNVIYTIQQQKQQQQIKSKPKKKRKQQQYQKKLKNKEGNIYDLLQEI